MPVNPEILVIVGQWVEKGENDLKNAAHTLTLGKECPTDTVCFHAQQCVEKYLKAMLVLEGKEIPKIHDIGELVNLLPVIRRPKLSPEEQELLTDYAVVSRYPGDYGAISLVEARRAVGLARKVRKHVRVFLRASGLRI